MRKTLFFLIFTASFSVSASFLETRWDLVQFIGERWLSKRSEAHQNFKEKFQSFKDGYADGMFYQCNAQGQSMTYNSYTPKEFFSNPEMEVFKKYRARLNFNESKIAVHRITCAQTSDVIYPFVTQNNNSNAYYPFEGGIYILEDGIYGNSNK
tara:strand:+ start:53 stop:511 length:459 start_codon:yes stop_codon:yes gene_type:complete